MAAPLVCLRGVLILYLREVQGILVVLILGAEHGILIHLLIAPRSDVLVDVG